jgi:hypothetical protein
MRQAGAESGRSAAESRAEALAGQRTFSNEESLRKDYQKQSEDFQKVRDSYNRINTASQSPTPAGDMSMLYAYMKMLDPGSVVRESEFRAAATARPLLERLGLSWDAVGSVWSGNKMTPNMRKDFQNRASQLYNSEAQQHQKRIDEYTRISRGHGLNPANVITDLGAAAPAGQGRYSEGVPTGSGSGGAPGAPGGQGGQGAPKILKIERIP